MKGYVLLIAAIIAAAPLTAASKHRRGSQAMPQGPLINVLIEHDVPSALLEAKGTYRVERKENRSVLSRGYDVKRYMIHAISHGLRWGEEYPDVYQISIIPTDRHSTISINGIQYKGIITVYHVNDNNITIINEISIEDYLKSTLALQYEDSSLSEEAMAALVIAARTEAYQKILAHAQSHTTHPWQVSASEVGYFGWGVAKSHLVDPSVDLTRFMVLESVKDHAPLQNPRLSAAKANELAQKGMDAQKILKSAFPSATIGSNISDQANIR